MEPTPMRTMYPEETEHRCHWPGCDTHVPPRMWGCRNHWLTLPGWLRTAIWRAYRPGQEVDKNPSEAYVSVARQAQAWAWCFEHLLSLYSSEEAQLFMTSPQPLLDGDTPEDRVREGRQQALLSLADVIAGALSGIHL